ncbi:sodium/hydrogen exchanger family protein [Diplogelasinospora grovesii]|uniref:Sodium/hydrogen exchanger family protein n=1 Tax=Diplogelasinospora grovesii TaxID=303347 RepID=A0AAN6RYF3_9PEZI|nr:sodium/hydrogen exchanger family protein [Diplogelasinospora grovesii]
MSSTEAAALAYHEPSILTILIQSSFLILLNTLNWALDALLYCGLIGQIFIGIAYGTPGGRLLDLEVEHVVVQLGYLGLILLVFEGGLTTSFPSLKANIWLSLGVAVTGIAAPIGLSFILGSLAGATNLRCFAAGAALCSTSLGTTLAVLRASGLSATRLGVVLTSAAMLDDVVGLVMVQVISNLGNTGDESVSAVTVVRPILVSVGFVVVAGVVCWLVVKRGTELINSWRLCDGRVDRVLRKNETALVVHTFLLVGLVAGASYAGTSNLFAAYTAGAVISWWDSEVSLGIRKRVEKTAGSATEQPRESGSTESTRNGGTGTHVFERYYAPALKWVLQPFFFASIGFSIPITRMFSGTVVWKGVVYAVLMMIGKLLCGLWLVRFPGGAMVLFRSMMKNRALDKSQSAREGSDQTPSEASQADIATPAPTAAEPATGTKGVVTAQGQQSGQSGVGTRNTTPCPAKPLSLYPAAILGLAMVPRGEIGFLISSIAQSQGVFGAGESEIFLIATWAIVLCTLIGPLCVGLLVRRVKALESKAGPSARQEVLGVWGVQSSPSPVEK